MGYDLRHTNLTYKNGFKNCVWLTRVQCMYLSNTTLFDGRVIYSIYYIRYNYMFRHLTVAIFRLYMKYLVRSYTGLIMGCIQWYSTGGEVGTRSCMGHGVWEV